MVRSKFCSKHYIVVDSRGCITFGWSDGLCPEKDTSGAICINEEGRYQFRLFPGGEENPPLYTMDGIPLYKWNGKKVTMRADWEIEEDRRLIGVQVTGDDAS